LETVIKISQSQAELAWDLAREIAELINYAGNRKKTLTIALSGGTTPRLMLSVLGDHFSDSVSWKYVHFFWVDERCVPPDNPESNYGMTYKVFLEKINIPHRHIHRIKGEKKPETEAARYSGEIMKHTGGKNNLPVFDLIILGIGEDGHTASIFPGNNDLLNSEKICEVSVHPVSLQKRVTLTVRVINNAENIIFLVTGANKANVVYDIIENQGIVDYPAAFIEPSDGVLKWYLDQDAASMLNQYA
jgi:6-phosphogluconolactonase